MRIPRKPVQRAAFSAGALFLLLAGLAPFAWAGADRNIITFNPDASWCWFQDERAVIDNGQLLLTGVSSEGDVTVTAHALETGESTVYVLHERFQANDHATPALIVLPDGRYLAAYSQHNGDGTLWRVTEAPGDISAWTPEARFDNEAGTTYSNLYFMASEGPDGRIYNFTRTREWDPNFIVSDNHGASWRYGGRLIDGGGAGARPYPRYAGNGVDEIHFITTEHHPRNYANSVYHGYIRGGQAFGSGGELVAESIEGMDAPGPEAFTQVFAGDEDNVAWTSDIQLDSNGVPYIAYSVMTDPRDPDTGLRGQDHRYRYARWDGAAWRDYEIAHAGSSLYPGEYEYTGLITLHPATPDVVFISTDADPVTGEPILVDGERRYEIFQGVTRDGGAAWEWTPITEDSEQDNLRPVVAANGGVWAVAWLRGEYRTYTNYNQAAVGFIADELPE